jgi:hypothetical protein
MNSAVRTQSKETIKKRLLYSLSWAVLAIALLCRSFITRDVREPFAEDGSDLILGALSSPWKLFAPVVDAIFIAPRFLASLATATSLLHAPFLLATVSIAILALVALYCTRSSLSSIAPMLLHRCLTALVIVGGIGAIEVAGFAMCIPYVLTLLLVILASEEPRWRARWLVPAVLIFSFSTNFSFIAAPLFFLRGVNSRDRWLIVCGILTLIPLPVNISLAALSDSPYSVAQFDQLGTSVVATVDRAIFYLFAVPLAGGLLSGVSDWVRMPVLCASMLVYLILWFKGSRQARMLSTGFAAAALLYISAHAVGRSYPMSGSILDFKLTAQRFAFLLVPCVFMAWSVLIFDQQWLSARAKNLAFFLMVFAQLATSAIEASHTPAAQQFKSWELFVSQLEEARRSLPGTPINNVPLAPANGGKPWGLIHCDTSDDRSIKCSNQEGNRDGIVYEISRFASKAD